VGNVGNGKYGGSIEKPKLITVFPINASMWQGALNDVLPDPRVALIIEVY
jgi:hypothetical protein